MFHELDMPPEGNGDGLLSYTEFITGMKRLGVDQDTDAMHNLFQLMDVDGSAVIDCRDFVQVLR